MIWPRLKFCSGIIKQRPKRNLNFTIFNCDAPRRTQYEIQMWFTNLVPFNFESLKLMIQMLVHELTMLPTPFCIIMSFNFHYLWWLTILNQICENQSWIVSDVLYSVGSFCDPCGPEIMDLTRTWGAHRKQLNKPTHMSACSKLPSNPALKSSCAQVLTQPVGVKFPIICPRTHSEKSPSY